MTDADTPSSRWDWLTDAITPDPVTLHPTHLCCDATDRLLLDFAADFIARHPGSDVAIIDDAFGALTLGVTSLLGEGQTVRVWSSSYGSNVAVRANLDRYLATIGERESGVPRVEICSTPTFDVGSAIITEKTQLCLLRLPKSQTALARYAAQVRAAWAGFDTESVATVGTIGTVGTASGAETTDGTTADAPGDSTGVVDTAERTPATDQVWGELSAPAPLLCIGGRVKYLTHSFSDILEESFATVRASRSRQKSRLLVGTDPRHVLAPDVPVAKQEISLPARLEPVTLCGFGSVFNNADLDHGSRLLLKALRDDVATIAHDPRLVDFGCGNGTITVVAHQILERAGRTPVSIIASDDNLDAVISTQISIAHNRLGDHVPADSDETASHKPTEVRVDWDYSLSTVPDNSVDVVLLNPPFHRGGAIDDRQISGLLDAARRVLTDKGELWLVFNSMLKYRPKVAARFKEVAKVRKNSKFTVLRARKPRADKDK